MIFGGVTVVCGIVGTLSGGVILDYMDATISNAFKVRSSTWKTNYPHMDGNFTFQTYIPTTYDLGKLVLDRLFLYFAGSFSFNVYRSNILLCCFLFQEHVCIFSSFCCW